MGILVKDVMKCFPYESGELLRVVEYIVYNTPGAHGYTPRDIDRRWSLASPLERALQPFTVSEMEPISDYVSKLYSNYRDIWVKVTSHMKDAAQKRADLANRYRKGKDISEGQRVLLRDPRLRKAGGRGWHKEPSAPGVIVETLGQSCPMFMLKTYLSYQKRQRISSIRRGQSLSKQRMMRFWILIYADRRDR